MKESQTTKTDIADYWKQTYPVLLTLYKVVSLIKYSLLAVFALVLLELVTVNEFKVLEGWKQIGAFAMIGSLIVCVVFYVSESLKMSVHRNYYLHQMFNK
jgi:hypothetical protein